MKYELRTLPLLLVLAACDDEGATAPDALLPDAEASVCPYQDKPVDAAAGLWQWHIHWSDQGNCTSFGVDSQVVVKVDSLQRGAVSPPLAIKAPCTQGQALVNFPSEHVFHGTFEIQSASGEVLAAPQIVNQDVHCSRDLYFSLPPL